MSKRQLVTVMLERDTAIALGQRVPATVDIRRVLDAMPTEMLFDELRFRGELPPKKEVKP